MNKDSFWIFGHLGLGDMIVSNALYRHYANLHKDKFVIIPIWEHNLAAVQWMLSDVPNIFFYPIETEQQLLTCRDSIDEGDKLTLGFYKSHDVTDQYDCDSYIPFNPVKWDSEFYRQAGLDPELKWKGFKLPELDLKDRPVKTNPYLVFHQDLERGFQINKLLCSPDLSKFAQIDLSRSYRLMDSAYYLSIADEIHCIDSSMLNLADLMETPYCKRFVFHRYARKGLPPTLKKNWEILD